MFYLVAITVPKLIRFKGRYDIVAPNERLKTWTEIEQTNNISVYLSLKYIQWQLCEYMQEADNWHLNEKCLKNNSKHGSYDRLNSTAMFFVFLLQINFVSR